MSKSNPEQYNPENEASFPATNTHKHDYKWDRHSLGATHEAKDETVDMINHERSVADELFECVWSFCGVGT